MIPFREYKKECLFRNNNLCSYWEKSIECHLLSCPFYSTNTSTRRKESLKKRKHDTVTFSISDLDTTGNSVHDIIGIKKRETGIQVEEDRDTPQQSSVTEKKVSRLTCIACGEQIFDDKFTTIRDPNGVVIYLHSKGKCDVRHEHVPIVRKRWLKMHNYGKLLSKTEETEEI
ncbi:MAG: hypothetical protein ACXABG_09535 [Promethearchaeota archaeon]|jgi:hypothetical protein